MINPKIRAAALDFTKSQFRPGMVSEMTQELHDAYAAECKLFDEHFTGMNFDEKSEYHQFVTWLDNSEMWRTDLTVDELYDVFEQIRYDEFMEAFESSIDEYYEKF